MALRLDLAKLRKEKGLKQSELAEILGVPQSSISAMENFKTNVSQTYINILIEKLSIDNINDYMVERDESFYFNSENNQGDGNGYNTNVQKGLSNAAETLLISKVALLEKGLDGINDKLGERLKNADAKRDELDKEIRELNHKLMALALRCAKNNVEYEDIMGM